MDNVFRHNSRSYYDVYNAFVQAYPNKPTWMFKEMGGLFDFQSELMNRIATDILYPQTRESAYAFAARCDYNPSESSAALSEIDVVLTGAMAKTIDVGYQIGGISTATGKMIIFEVTTATSSGGGATVDNIPVKQQKSESNILIATVDSTDDFMDYPIEGYSNVLKTSISLTINTLPWTRVDNFDNSSSSDQHFKLVYQSSGKSRIQFGDGTNGLKPTLNHVIYADFATTEGISGALIADIITINVGNDSDISTLTNPADCSGGSNPESVASIIRNARANARLRNMVWSKEDLEIAAVAADTSVVHALGVPGVGSAVIYIVPAGAAAAGGLLATVDTYVTALTQFGIMPITVLDTTYITPAITANITIRDGYVSATVIDLVEFAMTLTSCAFDIEVIEYYDDNGIDACREDVINNRWAWAFTNNENDALASIIIEWKKILGVETNRQYGDPLEIGDLWIMGNVLYNYGVDLFDLTAPLTTQTTTDIQMINTGTVTITDIT